MRPARISRTAYLLILMLIILVTAHGQDDSPQVGATLQDSLVVDRDGDGRIDAGDTLRYVLQVTNCGNAAAENVNFTGQQDPNTLFLANLVQISAPVPAANCPPQPTTTPNLTATPTSSAPTVAESTPQDGDTEIALNTNILLRFSKPVTVSGDWLEASCTLSGILRESASNVTVTGDGTSFTLDPSTDLQTGEICTVTVFAANVSASGSGERMTADHVFAFTTETPPTITDTVPADGATGVSNSGDLVITFDEPVTVSDASFTLECPAGTPGGTFSVSGSGTSTVTINPNSNLPAGTTCVVGVLAANVSDTDANDPPNLLDGNQDLAEGDDYTFSFTTDVDAAPTVESITPNDGALSVAADSTIEIVFSESVDIASAAAFSLECPTLTPIGFTVTTPAALPASATTFILTPAALLPDATTCTVTVYAASVTDTDTDEPPDNMAADFSAVFTTEAPPGVSSTNPADLATSLATSSNIVIDFDEPVDATTSSFTLECPVGTGIPFSISGSGTSSITLDPTGLLPATTTCTVAIIAAQVTDSDVIDPPDNMTADASFSFETIVDSAPTVDQPNIVPASTSSGADSATLDDPVSTQPTITVTFSEAVDLASGSFSLSCDAAAVAISTTPALPALNRTDIVVTSSTAIAADASCTLTVVAANIADADADDPPDEMTTDFTLTFNTDAPPAETGTRTEVSGAWEDVTGTGASTVDLDSDIEITFDESVNITFPANGLQCPAGNNIPVTVTGNGSTTITLNPDSNLPVNTSCLLAIPATAISDVDTIDAPDQPSAGISHSFQTVDDDAPTVSTNPAAGGSNVAVSNNITVTFDEPVTLSGAWFDLNCSISGTRSSTNETTGIGITIIENTPDLVYTIDPATDFTPGDVCTITIDSASVSDNDLIDAPDELDGDASLDVVDGDADDYTVTFSTLDMPPQVLSETPASAAIVTDTQTVTFDFTEAVDIAAGAFSFECPAGTPLSGGFTTSISLPATATTSIELIPTNPLPSGENCSVTIDSTLVADADPVDPPDYLDGDASGDSVDDADNYVLNFAVDAEPELLSSEVSIAGVSGTAEGATGVDRDTSIVLTFSEAVTVDTSAFDLECPVSSSIAFTITGSGTTSITIDPTPDYLPKNTLCNLELVAANISDVDTIDTPDTAAANTTVTFTTVNEDFPALTSAEVEADAVFAAIQPSGTQADAATDLRVTFNEAVTASGNWAELNCSSSGKQDISSGLSVTDADPVYTLDPVTDLTPAEECTLTIFATQIADDDSIDPPDNMAEDAVFTFTVFDTPPQVDTVASVPAEGDTVANNAVVTIEFTEMVDIAADAISLNCDASEIPFTPALPQANVTSITLVADSAFANGAACTVTLTSTLITDDDSVDAPDELDGDGSGDRIDADADDYVLSFSVDVPPEVTNASVEVAGTATNLPLSAGALVDVDSDIVIDFSENIDGTANSVTLECPDSDPVTFTGLPAADVATLTLNPDGDLPGDTECVVTVVASQTTDSDTIDPPDELDGDGDLVAGDDYSVSFTTQASAIDDAYTVTPHLIYDSGVATLSVRDNDEPTTISITGFGSTMQTANGTIPNGTNFITAGGSGGRVVMNSDGSFRFYPDAGDTASAGTATFYYTVTGGNTATVTLTFDTQQLVWFVDSTPAAASVCTGTNVGTQACPASTLATVTAVDGAGSTIFVAGGNYSCGISLETNQLLIGDGSSSTLQTLSGVTPVTGSSFDPYASFGGTDPVLSSSTADCITLATGNTLRGVTIGSTGNFAGIVGSNYGTVTISESTVNGDGQILNLDTGTVNATFDSLSSSASDNSFAALRVANSIANFASTNGVTISGAAAGVEAIQLISNSGTGFNLNAVTVTRTTNGRGIVLGNGTEQSAPVTFTSLAITTSSGTALEMNRQTGTVTVSANTGSISATGGAAVNIINTVGNSTPLAMSLGALTASNSSLATTCLASTSPAGFCVTGATGTLTATSLTVTAGINRHGIRINNSSAAFTFSTVSISGMTGTSAEADASPRDDFPDSVNNDGDGVFLNTNTGSFTIQGGTITNTNSTGADNVDVRASSDVVINNTTLSNAGKSNFQAINMTGTGSFNNGSVSGSAAANDAFYFRANTGTLTIFHIDNTSCTMSSGAEDCLEFITSGSHTATVDIGGTGDTGVWRANTNVVEAGSTGQSSLTLKMESIDVSPASTGLAGMILSSSNSSTLIFRVLNNNFTNIGNGLSGSIVDGVIRILPQDTSTIRGRFEGNVVDMVPTLQRQNVRIASANSPSTLELYINNNTLDAQDVFSAVNFKTECYSCTAQNSGDVFIQNNTITGTGDADGIVLDILDAAGTSGLHFDIRNNTVSLPAGGDGIGIAVVLYEAAKNVNVTTVNNVLSGGSAQFEARTTHANNDLCVNFTGHNSATVTLTNLAGQLRVVDYASIVSNNPGSTVNATGTISNAAACTTPTPSGLVQLSDNAVIAAAEYNQILLASALDAVMNLGEQTIRAQDSNFTLQLGPIYIGTIPAGNTVTMSFEIALNALIPAGTTSISLQGMVSGSNFESILTDDPETPAYGDSTQTILDTLEAVVNLPQTGEISGWQAVIVWGVRLGLLGIVIFCLIRIRRFFRA